jgi:hypothetical protein
MEKTKLKFSKKSNVPFTYSGFEISVQPIIGIEDQRKLRDIYIESFFNEGRDGRWDESFAEFMFRRAVISLKTNIEIESIQDVQELDEMIWGELYEKISSSISNYSQAHASVKKSSENEVKRMDVESGIGKVISGLFEKIKPFIDSVLEMKPEDLEKMKSEANDLVSKIQSEPIASVISDMKGNTPKKKKSKKG